MKVRITLKDSGVADSIAAAVRSNLPPGLDEDEAEVIAAGRIESLQTALDAWFSFNEVVTLEYDSDTNRISVEPKPILDNAAYITGSTDNKRAAVAPNLGIGGEEPAVPPKPWSKKKLAAPSWIAQGSPLGETVQRFVEDLADTVTRQELYDSADQIVPTYQSRSEEFDEVIRTARELVAELE